MVRILICCLLFSGCVPNDRGKQSRSDTVRVMIAPSCPDYLTSGEGLMVLCINRYRRDRNLPELIVDDTLMSIARERVSIFDHKHPRFGWVRDHARLRGFRGFCTDNIASGYSNPKDAVGDRFSGWGAERPFANSVGHDMQMKGYAKVNGQWVDMKFDRVGVGVYHSGGSKYYIAIFGRLDQ